MNQCPGPAGGLFGGAELEQQLIPGIGLPLQLAEPLPQGLQPSPAHAAFLQPPLVTPHQNVEFPLLGEELDRDRRPHRLPGLRQERLFQPRQAALGGAHQVAHGRVTRAHGRQGRFGGDAAVHDPDPLGAAILLFDLFQEAGQRGLIGRVARHHLVGQREAVRGHDQRDHHLHAIRTLVPAVAEPALAVDGRVALKIGTGQVIQQDIEAGIEQRGPPRAQKREERAFVHHQLVQAAVQRVAGNDPIGPQQVAQRALGIPVPVQPPVAPRIDEPVADLHLQHVQPPRPLPARRQARPPEAVQRQPVPHTQRQPARAPLAGVAHLHVRDPDPHHLAVQRRDGPVRGKQRQLPRARRLVQHRNRAAPRRALTVVDLPEIEHLALHDPAPADAHVLHHAPVAVLLAVLAAHLAAHEHT